ncbi:MAG TPA: hemerythrin domain-containing protein [Kofleriaceae bacterium]|nr:hemerythrin domain-containing protein [Kofleriaceae bacterium]
MPPIVLPRRRFVGTLLPAAGLAIVGCGPAPRPPRRPADPANEARDASGEAAVTPGEDLMQEHGLLERVLLIYDEVVQRIDDVHPVDLAILGQAAQIVRHFVEDYHEKNEEEYVFPRLEKAKREVDLVAVLRHQHERGRDVTDDIIRRAGTGPADGDLARMLRSFIHMYRPHAAREETVLLPAFREIIGTQAYRELGDQFEDREHERFGDHGFESVVAQVAQLEAALKIDDLAAMTP